MAVKLTDSQKEVIRKIIYAVETGGQVYGKCDYSDFTEAYTNSSAEHAITIGAGAWYANEAKELLNLIRKTDSALFKKLDTAGISKDLDNRNWSTYRLSKSSAKAKCIQRIISSSIGKKCQNRLVDEQMLKYINEAYDLGVTQTDAQMMCANFRHQGGLSAVKRILKKTIKPYTLNNLYASCLTDTGNQVGAYKNRQKMVYNTLKKYVSNTTEGENTVSEKISPDKVIKIAKNEVGYLEKKSNKSLDSKTANAGRNNYTKYWRDMANLGLGNYNGSYWCACFVAWCFYKAYGLKKAQELLLQKFYINCQSMYDIAKPKGQIHTNPKVGDVVLFWKSTRYGHTGIVISVSSDGKKFTTIEGNTSGGSTVVSNGGGVAQKTYAISSLSKVRFMRPKYTSASSTTPSTNSGSKLNKSEKWVGITTEDLNVRTGAGTKYDKCSFGPLKKNTKVSICDSEKADDGATWYYIKYNGKYGFVSSKYIKKHTSSTTKKVATQKPSSCLKSLSGTYKTTSDLNIRNGAGTAYTKMVVIPKETSVKCNGDYTSIAGKKWLYVEFIYKNVSYSGFASQTYLKK